ncbi:hypothetical protein Kpol_1058p30 [Vanderwaltozyma polyspora DSM 70294]|uniref:Ino eighty subunit 1 n=1 Tax=Vanderwaltozyma polyspora (strain ATCC 22028 / DSM 70294 / BCRC 21397 / CBS 2163 / NBRC 10782 / NRRL Y-8283 / UCD 57-17) TaxID=436907 RepID=A7TJR4_VANPO|nr:uncharacterized protein Kpol_1058p30 [Vanderwaltozyma polyspora DSM 70294]EDO17493.1 hypothetical protein Kpol_1058p30 [Vanderwaltozyma polyspora DSM 70294]
MGSRVYDPIHDVFQASPDAGGGQDRNGGSKVELEAKKGEAKEEEDGEPEQEPEQEQEQEHGDDDDEEEKSLAKKTDLLVPSVTTGKKKMKESSKYNRHLKKPDGDYFTRSDVQFHFLSLLLSDKRLLFTNIFKDVYSKNIAPVPAENETINVTDSNYDARCFVFNDKLTFSQAYILAVACSTKGSKILRDKMLYDQQVAFSTCVLGFLVNIGRLNTTVNFYLEMTSQLRTFHSVPCLQYGNSDPKSLQDTPRLKSILKSLAVGNDPVDLSKVYENVQTIDKMNIINLIFTICDNVSLINMKFIQKYVDVNEQFSTLFSMLDSPGYEPEDRCTVLLWLLYIHLETDLSDEQVEEAVKLFAEEGETKLKLRATSKDYDVDPEEEINFGKEQQIKRREFMAKINAKHMEEQKEGRKSAEASSPVKGNDIDVDEDNESTRNNDKEDSAVPLEESNVDDGTGEKSQQPPLKKRRVREPKSQLAAKERPSTASSLESSKSSNVSPLPKSDSVPLTSEQSDRQLRVSKLLETDEKKYVCKGLEEGKLVSQSQFINDLTTAQAFAKLKRKELGLMKAFNEFEDISLANVLGVRGRKRKKFKNNLLGFETDYLKYFGYIKKKLLNNKDEFENVDYGDNSEPIFKLPDDGL